MGGRESCRLFVFLRAKLLEFGVAEGVVERAADEPAVFLLDGVDDLGDPCHNRATTKLDVDQGSRIQGTSEEQADAIRRDVLHDG